MHPCDSPASRPDETFADHISDLFDDEHARSAILSVTTNTGSRYGFVFGTEYKEHVRLGRGDCVVRDADASLSGIPIHNVTHVGFYSARGSFVFLNADLRELWCSGIVTGIDELMVSAIDT